MGSVPPGRPPALASNYLYHAPGGLEEACELLARHGEDAKLVAGGTIVCLLLKERLLNAHHLVDLQSVGLDSVHWQKSQVTVGAMTTMQELADEAQARNVPALFEVLAKVASRRVRNVATVGGSVSWADATSDLPGILCALDARLRLTSASEGTRDVPMRDFVVDYYTTVTRPDEVLTQLDIPLPSKDTSFAYTRFTPRSQADRAALGVTVLVRPDGVRIADLTVVVTAAGPRPFMLPAIDSSVRGTVWAPEALSLVAEAYAEGAVKGDGEAESRKRRLLGVLVRRTLAEAWARAKVTGSAA